ncbi:bifunctional glutamate N-acetyltransferase/amino-acid acetyltransferase ArgJ [Tengunoibacter tsumagoiensis]|uniref:Arginine biosynthesis bifunctional protein ArgJ n=1 Tax=Tengunoibacter tsumagoiensis TaxID=2014871 RepID=A0A402A277_9CHLR|nr:bifunctional glutamate N-acetyltransferase/amino-acid acetyltransferase ArgJ [Tengunoibacter tsumagoiensis]GCE13250.1 arginine biosynthesis bifunctional protein ArgJ [Tengunoibacter tsumagoiensis]
MSDLYSESDYYVTAPQGYRAGSIACGIKSNATIHDLALLVSDVPCIAAGTFTTSSTRAAPVLLCQERLHGHRAQAIIINSGNANCATGEQGRKNAARMTAAAAALLGIDKKLVLCSSTGIIGRQLPIEKIEQGIKQLTLTSEGGVAFSNAILTTDSRPKRMTLEFLIDGKTVRLGGVAKGSGMICPQMATMLCYLTTDAAIDADWLQQELQLAVDDSFNMISVDGDMSTNDSCILLANGLAGNQPLHEAHPDAAIFRQALRKMTIYLAREIARDGEGATKLMTVHIQGASSREDARKAARAITLSPIWQCALTGEDPNWGRLVAALGASGCALRQESFDVFLGSIQVAKGGVATEYEFEQAQAAMLGPEIIITIDLHIGSHQATAWGCNLTAGYIEENTVYHR